VSASFCVFALVHYRLCTCVCMCFLVALLHFVRCARALIARYRTISHDIARYRTISHDIARYRTISRDIARYRAILSLQCMFTRVCRTARTPPHGP
jgi:hypothetical protein